MENKNVKHRSLTFIQIMTVIAALIAAVLFKAYGKNLYEECRLRLSNLIADRGEYPSAAETPDE